MRILGPVLAALLVVSAGCNNDKPKQEDTKKSEPTPVPSDMVFNDFVPATGGGSGIHARDAGLEGGLADVAGGQVGDGSDEPAAAPGAADKLKVTDPGADPKAVRKYTFTQGKVEKRIIAITQSQSQSMPGAPPQSSPEMTIKLYVDLTAKTVKKEGGATIEAKVTKIELPGAPAQITQALAAMNGLSGTFDVTAQGDAGEMQMAANAQMRDQLAATVLQGLSQAVQLLVAPLPEAPIGVGAKWEAPARPGDQDQGFKHFTAKDMTADGANIDIDIEMKIPKHQQQTERGTILTSLDGKGHYTFVSKWSGFAQKVDGNLQINQKLEAPAKAGQPSQSAVQSQTIKHAIETPGK